MAKTKFDLNFDGFLDLAREIDEKWSASQNYLIPVVVKAFEVTKDYVNNEIEKAMEQSPYNFNKGQHYSLGKAKASLEKVRNMPVEVNGTVVTAYAGVDNREALEFLLIIYGTPHLKKDTKLYNAVKVKGKHKKEVSKIQQGIFILGLEGKL